MQTRSMARNTTSNSESLEFSFSQMTPSITTPISSHTSRRLVRQAVISCHVCHGLFNKAAVRTGEHDQEDFTCKRCETEIKEEIERANDILKHDDNSNKFGQALQEILNILNNLKEELSHSAIEYEENFSQIFDEIDKFKMAANVSKKNVPEKLTQTAENVEEEQQQETGDDLTERAHTSTQAHFLDKHTQTIHAPRGGRRRKLIQSTSTRQEGTKTKEKHHKLPTQNITKRPPLLPTPNIPPIYNNTKIQRIHSQKQNKRRNQHTATYRSQTGLQGQKTNGHFSNNSTMIHTQHPHYFGTLRGFNPFLTGIQTAPSFRNTMFSCLPRPF